MLTGTGVRAIKGLTHHKHPVGNSHWAVHFGWEKGEGTNKTAGCRIVFRNSLFPQKCVTKVCPAPPAIAGRGGLVRLRSKRYDITVLATYAPPISGSKQQVAKATKTARQVNAWTQEQLDTLPTRTLPLVGGDFNSGVGLDADGIAWEKGVGRYNLAKPKPGTES